MSEPSTGSSRSRRRAVRSAGPPPDELGNNQPVLSDAITSDEALTDSLVEPEAALTDSLMEPSEAQTVTAAVVALTKPEPHIADAPADSEPPQHTPKRGPRRWLRVTGAAVAALVVIALVASSGFFMYGLHSADTRDARRADYIQTAKQAILNLTTIKDDTAKADIDRVLSVASGELKAEYSERKDAYASVVEQAKVKATGEIIESAIENEDTSSARVLIAAKQTLTNAGMADPQTRFYRFRVTLTDGDNGVTASQVEFVA
ncbi:hypothetical protein [Nocardia australiensis]|uniref:hypothetical protein n=1 Tax=Nocardia australiensis TaxID=2887191 RepID=UPI001D1547A9|nr:hypothetical protein [Nocardia australiensis]